MAPTDPPWWLGLAVFAPSAVAAIGLAIWPSERADGWDTRLKTLSAAFFALLAFAGLGAGAAQLRTTLVTHAPFEGREEPFATEGWVIANDANENGPRLRLLVHSIEGVADPPRYVRFSVAEAGMLTPGRAARARPAGCCALPTRALSKHWRGYVMREQSSSHLRLRPWRPIARLHSSSTPITSPNTAAASSISKRVRFALSAHGQAACAGLGRRARP